jgi:flagellar L-ring protein precursor FlgH
MNKQSPFHFSARAKNEARRDAVASASPGARTFRAQRRESGRNQDREGPRAGQHVFRFRSASSLENPFLGLGLLLGLLLFLPAAPARADSLWKDDVAKPMYADKRAARVGDIVTILVQENTTATKANSTATSKTSSVDSSIASFLYSPAASGLLTQKGSLPALKFSGASTFAGGGTINNSEQIISSVAVRVVDVLPNRNLIIEGTRQNSFGDEQQTVVLRGTIRQDDIMANNTVYSYNISDATIKIVSKGTITESQRKGWFHRLWDKFSPF